MHRPTPITAITLSMILAACAHAADPPADSGPAKGGGSSTTSSGGNGGAGGGNTSTTPVVEGFDIDAREGGWWKFHYQYAWDGAYPEQHDTTFLLVLGKPQQTGAEAVFPVQMQILSSDGSDASKPRFDWSYVSFDGHRIRGSQGGAFQPLFDAVTGKWPGTNEGLFGNLNTGGLRQASQNGSDWRVSKGSLDSGCEYIEGYGSVCDNSGSSYNGWDLFRPGVGPAGSYRQGCSAGCLTYSYDLLDASPDASKPEPASCPVGNGLYCGGNGINGTVGTLYDCADGTISVVAVCALGCLAAPPGQPDKCKPCPQGNGAYCGDDGLGLAHGDLYHCIDGTLSFIQACGCYDAGNGQDFCVTESP